MIRRVLKIAVRAFWLLPGFLLWASFPPMGEKTDCLFALAPLLWLSRNADARRNFRTWFANGLLFWVATLSWMPAIVKNGGPWPLVVLGWFALAAYCALYFGAFGWLSAKAWRWICREPEGDWQRPHRHPYLLRIVAIAVMEPLLWAGLEIARSRLFGGFAWNQLGVAPVNGGFGAPAALGGVYLVSALVILVNGTIASVAERMIAPIRAARGCPQGAFAGVPRWLRSVETALPLALVWAVHAAGEAAVRHPADADGVPFKVALVQRNFPCPFMRESRTEPPISAYRKLAPRFAALRPDLVVLSESALCEFGAIGGARAESFAYALMDMASASAVLAGGSREEGGREYNSAVLYAGPTPQVYDKVHLVPFGEYIPGDKLIPALQALAPVGSCTPGEPKLLELATEGGEKVPFGVAICFEDTDSALARRFAADGARMLAFITNDSWFYGSVETVQHAWQAVARAVETGLPVVRVGNSGVTGEISPDGCATWLADGREPVVDRPGAMLASVRFVGPGRGPTPYVRFGDKPILIAFLLFIGGMILVQYKEHHEKNRYLSM